MKLNGSGNPDRGAQKSPKQTKNGKVKRKLTLEQVAIRIVVTLMVILALCAAGAAVWFSHVRAPDPIKRPNNPTIVDTENGDTPDQMSDLEMGDRVADYFTFVVGAVDEDQTRTDALMVCGFDTQTKKINILNIPRDTMSNVSRRGAARKINAAYGTKKGIEQTKAEIKKLIGFTPDYYIVVNFQGIEDIVDAIGGVDYEIPFRMYYKDPSQNLSIDFKPGMTHMDGEEVVEFLRWRKNNGGVKTGDANYTGGDEERITKQQEFLKHLASQVLTPGNIGNIGKISDAVFANVKTDLTAGEILWMGMQAVGTSSDNIQMHTLPGYDSYSYAGTDTMYSFFFPYRSEILELVNEYFNPYINKVTSLDIVSGPDKSSYTRKDSSGSSGSSGSGSSGKDRNNDRDDDRDDRPDTSAPVDPADPEAGGSGGSTDSGATPPPDTGTTPPDTGATTPDTGTTPPDTGATTPDTGNTTPDTGTAPPDTGNTTPDTGGATDGGTAVVNEPTTPEGSGTTPAAPPQNGSVDPEA